MTEKRKREKKRKNHFYSISSRCFLHPPKIAKIKREKRERSFLQYFSQGVQLVSKNPQNKKRKNGKTLKTLWFHLLSLFFFHPKSQEFSFIIRIPIPNHLIFAIPIHPKGFQGIFAICGEFLIYEWEHIWRILLWWLSLYLLRQGCSLLYNLWCIHQRKHIVAYAPLLLFPYWRKILSIFVIGIW